MRQTLATWSDTGRATWTAVGTITSDRVVREGLNNATRTYQHTVTGVVVNLALSDLNTRRSTASITSPHAIPTIGGNKAVPDSDCGHGTSSSGIRKDAVGGVVGKHGVMGSYASVVFCVYTVVISSK
jgi:hypothetical protein